MGDWFQTVVDKDVSPQNAKAVAADILDWLISAGVVLAERDDCVLSAESGHRPGPAAETVVDSTGWSSSFHDLAINGLEVVTERSVFDGGQGMPTAVICPRCDATTALVDDSYQPIHEVWKMFVDEGVFVWDAGEDDVTVPCPSCAQRVELADWKWADGTALGLVDS
ncbi:hypothetical protein ACIA5H_36690 [Nocardia sp. NPDC051900]|uniref:hypothetical protein n=1 Tax=Nocardia sp. NPDC051900 TaxID=3364326 RepID=UPI00378D2031